MAAERKKRKQLIRLLESAREQIARLEASQFERKRGDDGLPAGGTDRRHLIEHAREGICAVDGQGMTSFVNPRMAEIL